MKGKKKKLDVIVLNSVVYGDVHKIIRFFSRTEGNLSAMVYGARKYKSQLRSKIETLSFFEGIFHFSTRSKMLVLEEASLKKTFVHDFKYEYLWKILPFLNFLLLFHFENEEENEKIFDMFVALLEALSHVSDQERVSLLLQSFAIKALIKMSIIPGVIKCYSCGKKLISPVFFQSEESSLLCGECAKENHFVLNISDFYPFLKKIIYSRFNEIVYFTTDDVILNKNRDFVDKLFSHYLGKKWSDFESRENPFSG